MSARLRLRSVRVLRPAAPQPRVPIGAAALENADRVAWQSARTRDGAVAPLPLTEAQAWAEALSLLPTTTN